jgi:predicted Holliday junction resolvase-like endonuclease
MELIMGLLCLFVAFLLYAILNLQIQINRLKSIIESINHDLNMVSKTMENMHKHEKAKELSKQILKG